MNYFELPDQLNQNLFKIFVKKSGNTYETDKEQGSDKILVAMVLRIINQKNRNGVGIRICTIFLTSQRSFLIGSQLNHLLAKSRNGAHDPLNLIAVHS